MAASEPARRMVVGITGASGTVYGIRVLEALRALKIESHLVISKAGDQTRSLETDMSAVGAAGARRQGLCAGRHRRLDLERLVPDDGHDRGALLGADPERDRDRRDVEPGRARRRCLPEGAPAGRPDVPRDAAACRPHQEHAGRHRDGRHRRGAGRRPSTRARGPSTRSSPIRWRARSTCSASTPRRFRDGPVLPARRGPPSPSAGAANDATTPDDRRPADGGRRHLLRADAQQARTMSASSNSAPKANAHIGRKSSAFFVRFDRPVDHIKSTAGHQAGRQGDRAPASAARIGSRRCCSPRRRPCRRATTCCTGP